MLLHIKFRLNLQGIFVLIKSANLISFQGRVGRFLKNIFLNFPFFQLYHKIEFLLSIKITQHETFFFLKKTLKLKGLFDL